MAEEMFPTDPPAIVRPAISNVERSMELIHEAKAIDDRMRGRIALTAEEMVERGQVLIKAKQLCGKGGPWREHLKRVGWSERTARRYMSQATEKAKADMVAGFESHTHKQLDGNEDEEESSDDETPPLTVQERKILYSLIATVKPGLAKKLRDGTKKLSDAELHKEVPPSCDNCRRFGAKPLPCEICTKLRLEAKASLFESDGEPENEDDPGSAPAPPPDPYKEVKSLVTKLSGAMTKLAAEDAVLYEVLVACKLMDHSKKTPSFCPLAGTKKIIEKVEEGETVAAIVAAYQIASGGFVPPMYERKGRR